MNKPTSNSTDVQSGASNVLVHLIVCARPHQWVKNLFVLAPLLFGQQLSGDSALTAVLMSLCGVISFSFMSSGVYMFNDVVDAASDRAHPNKRTRPIASGRLSARTAIGAASVMILAGLAVAAIAGLGLMACAFMYVIMMITYCLVLKHLVILDAMTIACGFVLRLIAGAVAVDVAPSHWLILCAFLLALFLAFAKRRQELLAPSDAVVRQRRVLAQYSTAFLDQVIAILVASAIICYAIYTVAPETITRFETDALVYGNVFVIYGLLRYMVIIRDPKQGQDPSRLLVSDMPLLVSILCWAIYNAVIIYRVDVIAIFLG